MSAAPDLLALRDAYRDELRGGDFAGAAQTHLLAAADALNMALLTLSGLREEDAGDRAGRSEQARAFLVEAVTSLSRARIYNPKIRTLALPTLLAADCNPDAELRRLHQLATRLLWQNHLHLPARLQAEPLAPDEEAQLRDVFRGLARHARIGRVMRHKGMIAVLTLLSVGPLLAIPLVHLATAACLFVIASWLVGRGREVSVAADAPQS